MSGRMSRHMYRLVLHAKGKAVPPITCRLTNVAVTVPNEVILDCFGLTILMFSA